MPVEPLLSAGLDPTPLPVQAAGDGALPMQTTGDGATTVAVAVFLGQAVAFAFACWIAARTYDGYREAGGSQPALYWLAVGIVLLAAAPTAVRFLLPTLFGAAPVTTQLLATSSEIAGLVTILYAVFGRP